MALKHHLRVTGARVPELHAAVLGSRQHPVGIGRQGNRQNKVAVALKRLDALATLIVGVGAATGRAELPHLDGAIERAGYEVLAAGRKGDRVDRVLVTLWALETLDEEARVHVPDTHALVQRTSSDVLGVGGNGHRCDAILDGQRQRVGAVFNIPQSDGSVARAGSDGAAIASEVQRINVLLVTVEVVANGSRVDVPDLCAEYVSFPSLRQLDYSSTSEQNLLG